MLQRTLKDTIISKLGKGKAILVIGPRQVGKTTLIREVLKESPYLFLDGDIPAVRESLTAPSIQTLKTILGNHRYVFIDEAQRIHNIGITLKIIVGNFQDVQLVVSGSSAFELNASINEPLTGRKWEYELFPISWQELEVNGGYLYALQQLESRMVYGSYPEVINHPGEEVELLNELAGSYLYKDILSFGGIRKPEILEKILRALAFQVGNEVSYNEIAQLVGIDKNTVSNYINLLEQSFVIFSLTSFSRNLRNEVRTNKKVYFYDNGIRNAIIQNFNPLELRQDVGALWENFLIAERKKRNAYKRNFVNSYFWRNFQQQEVDYVEEGNGEVKGFEFKWNPKANTKVPSIFETAYHTRVEIVNRENFRDFLM
jgi:predicted AAA+ superfamily ATPase